MSRVKAKREKRAFHSRSSRPCSLFMVSTHYDLSFSATVVSCLVPVDSILVAIVCQHIFRFHFSHIFPLFQPFCLFFYSYLFICYFFIFCTFIVKENYFFLPIYFLLFINSFREFVCAHSSALRWKAHSTTKSINAITVMYYGKEKSRERMR